MSQLAAIFSEVNLLLFVPLILLLIVWFILGLAQPLCVIADCLDSDLSLIRKILWLGAMVFSLGLASMIYPWFNPTGRVLRVADRIMLLPLWILLGIYFLLYCFHDGVRGLFNHWIISLTRWIAHSLSLI